MAKSQLFKPPMQFIYTHGGVFPVRRGARDEETFITAETILAQGGAITMYCEGGRSRTGKVAEQAKRGIGRLALRDGRAGRADRDPRLLARAQLEAAAVPEGHGPVRRRAALGARSRTPRASSSRRSPTRSSSRSAACTRASRSTAARASSARARPAPRRAPHRARLTQARRGAGQAVGASEASHIVERAVSRKRAREGAQMERSLNVGEVIRRMFEIYVDQASVLMPAAAVVFVFTRHPQARAGRCRARARARRRWSSRWSPPRCSRAWSSSWSPTFRTAGATPPSASCSRPSGRCSAS